MAYTPNLRGLMRTILVLSGAVMSITFIFMLIANMELQRAILLCVMGGFIILVLGIADIYILGFKSGTNSYVKLNRKQRSWRYLISYFVSPLIYLSLWLPFEPFISDQPLQWYDLRLISIFTLSSWIMNTLIILLYNYNYLHFSKIYSEMENLKLQALVSETSNQVLKQQIHPHFLFNVLNTVKTLYKQDIHQGESYLVHLANFLRASLSNTTARIVTLENEIELCSDYIEMQRIRFGSALTFQVELIHHIAKIKYVPYFGIQTLLENAIKHNDLTEESPLNIRITLEEDYINVSNNFQPRHFKEPSTGQGLANLSERYRLLAGKEIQIIKTETQFSVSINLLDNEDSHH